MLNFTVGPVQAEQYICDIGAEPVPYFRTTEFSEMMKESEHILLEIIKAPAGSRAVFMTGSGTASMEAAIMNIFHSGDKVVVVNGGSFGDRFSKLCDIYGIDHTDILLNPGETLKFSHLANINANEYTAFLINMHETSTGVLYDMNMVGEYCKNNNLLLIADVISSFLADPIDMVEMHIDVAIASSQKALACPPGISMIIMDEDAVDRVYKNETRCMYLDLKDSLKNGERGQTPFTPAVGILRQIHARLLDIQNHGGAAYVIKKTEKIAKDFRARIEGLPFVLLAEKPSNAVTSVKVDGISAKYIFEILKNEYGIWICPNGGELGEKVFRVGHIGNISLEDNKTLVDALNQVVAK